MTTDNRKCCDSCNSDPTGIDYSYKEHCMDSNCKCHQEQKEGWNEARQTTLTNYEKWKKGV